MQFYQCITDFIFVQDKPEKADIIFVPGGNYPDAALHAASLYHQGYAPLILPSGRYSIVTGHFSPGDAAGRSEASYETEWEYLKAVLQDAGVPEESVLREDRATFTYENAICSRQVTETAGIAVSRAILCCQAFHARRSLMYYQEQFPETEFFVCPVVTRGIGRDTWFQSEEGIDTVLGEVERCGKQFHEIMRRHSCRK